MWVEILDKTPPALHYYGFKNRFLLILYLKGIKPRCEPDNIDVAFSLGFASTLIGVENEDEYEIDKRFSSETSTDNSPVFSFGIATEDLLSLGNFGTMVVFDFSTLKFNSSYKTKQGSNTGFMAVS